MPRKGAKEDEECFAEPAPQISFCELEKSMTAVSGDDAYGVDTFIKDFEDIANLMQWTGIEKLIYAKRLLKGTAKLFLRSLTGTTTWELLKTGLKEEFGLHLNSAAIHKTISNRKMKPGETYQQYFLQLKELAVLGNIEDDALMEYIIDGIPDNEMNKTILYGASNIKEFRKKLDLYAEIKKKCRTSNKAYNQSTTSKPTTSGWKKPLPKKRCFNCGDLDHESSGCSKGIKCFRCNDFGHKSTDCPKNIKKTLEIKCNKENESQAPYKEVMINNVMVKSLIDTGSDVNLMNESTFTQIQGDTCNYHPDLVQSLTGIGDCEVHTRGSCTPRIEIDGCQCEATFYIIEDDKIPVDVIIGNPILQDIELSFKSGVISAKRILQLTMLEDQTEEPMIIGNFKYKDQIEKILTEYDPGKCCKESKVELKLLLTDETPVYQNPRRLSPLELEIVDKQIKEWLKDGVIKPSNSDFASPIVLAKKKNKGYRLCVDYRKLNKKIIKERFPLPLIEDQIDRLKDATMFTTLDLKNGFFHVNVCKESQKYTSFVTPRAQFEFQKMPFGLSVGPSVFQRFLNDVFQDLILDGVVLTYLDDLILPFKLLKEARPLTNLLKKGVIFNYDEECEKAVETLRTILCQSPVLQIYNQDLETELHTDASADGYGAILLLLCKQVSASGNKIFAIVRIDRMWQSASSRKPIERSQEAFSSQRREYFKMYCTCSATYAVARIAIEGHGTTDLRSAANRLAWRRESTHRRGLPNMTVDPVEHVNET
ncbi:uncharacterized protein K02A2.6-like [Bombyx mori]|uniref:uncharacterized protein K02A2.6-like n=1 Tax=Bombyx mori TaxID=7091 RepID=UPI002ED250B2